MPERQNSHGAINPMDPMDLWKEWNASTATMWSIISGGNRESFVDPYGLYQAWIKGVEEAQGELKAGALKIINPEEFWKNWSESITDGWRKAAGSGTDLFGLTARWLELMEEARAKMFAEGNIPTDPFTFYKQWYDAISETWSKVVGDLIGTEEFTKASSEFLKNYLNFIKSSRKMNEEYFKNLQIPTLTDIARVAELIVLLEDKVDKIEDTIEDLSDNFGQLATNESITGLAGRMNGLEQKLSSIETVLEGINSQSALEGRINQVESKLDKVLAALERIDARSQQPKPTTAKPATAKPATAKSANPAASKSKSSAKPAENISTSSDTSVK